MKKSILLFSLMLVTVVVFGQEPDTVANDGNFYDKYASLIWPLVSGALAVAVAWLKFRENRFKNAMDTLRVAGDDDSPQGRVITLDEWRGILKGFAAVFGKLTEEEKNEILAKLKGQ
ncbi:MAG TPA: hypothetical protein VD884_05685 [Ohtaekwangia sp.]|nr:hypothetical protein [Ohtaekwangia sp.]